MVVHIKCVLLTYMLKLVIGKIITFCIDQNSVISFVPEDDNVKTGGAGLTALTNPL